MTFVEGGEKNSQTSIGFNWGFPAVVFPWAAKVQEKTLQKERVGKPFEAHQRKKPPARWGDSQ